MVLDVLLVFKDLREFLVENGHSEREGVYVLVEVFVGFVVFALVEFLSSAVIVLRIEV
jgi:hypothetical protein